MKHLLLLPLLFPQPPTLFIDTLAWLPKGQNIYTFPCLAVDGGAFGINTNVMGTGLATIPYIGSIHVQLNTLNSGGAQATIGLEGVTSKTIGGQAHVSVNTIGLPSGSLVVIDAHDSNGRLLPAHVSFVVQ